MRTNPHHFQHHPVAVVVTALGCAALASALEIAPATAAPGNDVHGGGKVTVTIPGVVFSGTDALPTTLAHGKTYTVRIMAMATAGSGGGAMSVTASGATVTACSAKLPEIQLSSVTCQLTVPGKGTHVTLRVVGSTNSYTPATKTFAHLIS